MLRQALTVAAARLQAAGIERSRFEARLLLAHATGLSLEAIVADDVRVLTPAQQQAFEHAVARRAAREPMSQILGWREFYGRRFAVSGDVLTPRPDSETLIDAALAHFAGRAAPLRILDLGTGSGCLLLTLLAQCPHAAGIGLDKSAAALKVARANADALGLAARVEWRQGDWLAPGWADGLGQFDLLIANPPYIPSRQMATLDPEVATHEPALALDGGPDGLAAYRHLTPATPALLKPQGLAVFEVGAGQADAVAALLAQAGLEILPPRRDLAGIARCVLAASR